MKIPLLIVATLISTLCFSQQQTRNWYFGNNSGIVFDGNPVSTSNGQLNTIEGCTSISNASGNLLFYTNGKTVWNKNHQVMPNGTGLFGDLSSSQAAVIVKKPGSGNRYYIFTSNPFPENGGLRYSEVDMSLNNASGAVIAKNILLQEPTCEKIAIVNHTNGHDVWVISHAYGSSQFYSTLVTSEGVAVNAIVNNAGMVVSEDSDRANAIGYMKISPDGKKLIACHSFLMKAELFDFDAATGLVSNPIVISNEGMHVYGAEFSTNSKVLYISAVDEKKLFQFNLDASDIPASESLLGDFSVTIGALQMGPDGKIYLAMAETNNLSIISSPDMVGNACGLQVNQIYLDGMCMLGLPSFNASFFDHTITITNTCAANPSYFTVSTGQNIESVLWNFGDNTSSTEISPTHNYASGGDYLVMATVTNGNCIMTKARRFTISEAPVANEIADQNLCIASGQIYDLSQNNAGILNGQSLQNVSIAYFPSELDAQNQTNALTDYILQAGAVTFYARVNNLTGGCNAITDFTVVSSMQPGAVVPTAYIICENAPYDGIESFDLTLKDLEILGGQDSNEFHVSYYHSEAEALAGMNEIASPYINTLYTETLYASVRNSANTCNSIVPMQITVREKPKATLIPDFVICDDGPYDGFATFDLSTKDADVLNGLSPSDYVVRYFTQLSDAENNASPISGMYTNTVIYQSIYARIESVNDGCMVITPLRLHVRECEVPASVVFSYPKYFTPNGDAINDFWQIVYPAPADIDITIFDRNGRVLKMMSGKDVGWDGTMNGNLLPQSDYWFTATGKNKIYKGHFSMLR